MVTDQYDTITVDVDFTHDTGYSVYGSGLTGFPFDGGGQEEDAFVAMLAINEALNAHGPIPEFAGKSGVNSYFIGVEEETGLGQSAIAAIGGANYGETLWTRCEEEGSDNCIFGSAVLQADQRFTYADIRKAEGGSCDNKPPPEPPPGGSFDIIPCISGSWFLPARDGEGYVIEIIGSSLEPEMLAYFYTYDDAGNQMWLIAGQGPINGDTAVLATQVTSGAVYGDDFDPDDVLREDWGTLTFKFTSESTGTVVRDSTMGFGTTTVDIIRLTYLTGLACP